MLPKTAALAIFDLLRRHTEGLDFGGVILGCILISGAQCCQES